MTKRRQNLPPDSFRGYDSTMLQSDSHAVIEAQSSSNARMKQGAQTRSDQAANRQKSIEIQPFPQWARLRGGAQDDATNAHVFAGAGLALLDQVLRGGPDGVEPPFAGVLRQRLALRAAAACAARARHREDEGGLRDAEQLAPVGDMMRTSPAGRIHRLWRLFATRQGRPTAHPEAHFIRAAAELVDLPSDIDVTSLAALVQEVSTRENPLASAARVSAVALQILGDAPRINAEILALWLSDVVLAQRLRWAAPLPLLATTIMHPSLRATSFGNSAADVSSGAGNIRDASFGGASNSRAVSGRRPRPSDPDWSLSVARAAACATQEAYALAGELSRRSETLLSVAPKLRAKKAARVVDLLLADDCVSAARAAKAAGLSDRAGRRLFERLVALGAVPELSGRANFRLYGL